MRVISGKAGGRRLKSRNNLDVRPTQDRVKEAVFNILAPVIYEKSVLDLFAGFGGLGLEAVSRGASEAVLVERDYKNAKIIKENISICDFEDRVSVEVEDVFGFLKMGNKSFDIIFMDPPYKRGLVEKALIEVVKNNVLAEEGYIVAEQHKDELVPDIVELNCIKKKEYGSTRIVFMEKGED